ncbi:MAG: hypothetical protein V1886_00420 [archaeon]
MVDMVYGTGWSELDVMVQSWAQHGVFSVLLPFVLVFAVVFAILERTKVLGEKPAVNAIISVAIGLLSLQMDFYRKVFYAEFFQNLGTGIIILLALLIITGLFITSENGIEQAFKIGGMIVGIVIFLVILINSAGIARPTTMLWGGSAVWVSAAVVLGLIIWTIVSSSAPAQKK